MQQQVYRVVQVTDQLDIGGAEQIIVMLANLLQAHGHQSAVMTTVAPGPLAKKLHPSVQLINLRRGWKWNPVTMYKLVKVLKRFDIVHVHAAYNLRYVYLATRLFFLRKPIFYHEHYGNAVNTKQNTLQQYIYAQTIFIAVSNDLAMWAIKTLRILERRVYVLRNTIVKTSVPTTYKAGDKIMLCTVGNILPNKNFLFALQLLQALQINRKQRVYLTIIGKIADENYHQQLSAFINKNNLQQSISFIHDCNDVQSIVHQFTAAIHCAFSESGPLALIEYLAQGLPFITYNTGEVAQQLQPHLPECIMNDFEIENWVKAVEQLVTLPRQQIAIQFDKLYRQYFSPEVYYRECTEIYNKGLP